MLNKKQYDLVRFAETRLVARFLVGLTDLDDGTVMRRYVRSIFMIGFPAGGRYEAMMVSVLEYHRENMAAKVRLQAELCTVAKLAEMLDEWEEDGMIPEQEHDRQFMIFRDVDSTGHRRELNKRSASTALIFAFHAGYVLGVLKGYSHGGQDLDLEAQGVQTLKHRLKKLQAEMIARSQEFAPIAEAHRPRRAA